MNFGKERSEGAKRGDELGVEEVGLDAALEHTLHGIAAKLEEDEDKKGEFRPYTFLLCCFLAWCCVIAMGTVAYVLDTQRMHQTSDSIKEWVKNMDKEGCGKYHHMKSFHNKMF